MLTTTTPSNNEGPAMTWTQHTPHTSTTTSTLGHHQRWAWRGPERPEGPRRRVKLGPQRSVQHRDLAKGGRHLHRQRRSVQTSMEAYVTRARQLTQGRSRVVEGEMEEGADAMETLNNDSSSSSCGTTANNNRRRFLESDDKSSVNYEPHPRISLDSGVDVTETWVRDEQNKDEGEEDTKHRRPGSLPVLHTSYSPLPARSARRASFACPERPLPDSFRSSQPTLGGGRLPRALDGNLLSPPQQRPAWTTTETHTLSAPATTHRDSEDPELVLPLPETVDPLPSISPFPQFNDESLEDTEEQRTATDTIASNKTNNKSKSKKVTSPVTLTDSKLKKTKALYWSIRKQNSKNKASGRNNMTRRGQAQKTSSSSSSSSPSLRRGTVSKTLGTTSATAAGAGASGASGGRDGFRRFFRYSDEVDSLLKSMDSCSPDTQVQRQAAEMLPTLDLEDLRQEKKTRLTLGGRRGRSRGGRRLVMTMRSGAGSASGEFYHDASTADDDSNDVVIISGDAEDGIYNANDDVTTSDGGNYDDTDDDDDDDDDDDRSDYGSDDRGDSNIQSQGEKGREGEGEGDGGAVVSRKALRVSFCLTPQYVG